MDLLLFLSMPFIGTTGSEGSKSGDFENVIKRYQITERKIYHTMKTLKNILPLLIAAFLLPLPVFAQEQITIPLSNPGEPGSLSIEVMVGSITVNGYDGEKVLISYIGGDFNEAPEVTEDGLKRISGSSGIEVSEENNHVEIEGTPVTPTDFEIKVPRNFSLNLSTMTGNLLVKNISGEMELSSMSGDITLRNVSGSAVVNTAAGDITAVFNEIAPHNPMAFTNLSGDIDVAFPADAQFSVRIESQLGEVYTDFNMNFQKNRNSNSSDDLFKISIGETIIAEVNGGGPEYLFKSLNGDIYIRKQ